MAVRLKNAGVSLTSTSLTNVYTCPTNFTARIYNQYVTNDFYDYHIDPFKSTLSNSPPMQFNYGFTIGFTDDYEGGEFVFQDDKDKFNVEDSMEQGTVIFFPSYIKHGVQPVTEGIRYSCVSWLLGNHFK